MIAGPHAVLLFEILEQKGQLADFAGAQTMTRVYCMLASSLCTILNPRAIVQLHRAIQACLV